MLTEGTPFPDFRLEDQSGTVHTRESLKGSPTVVYFYPADDTSGCTVEACEFRDSMPQFAGVKVIGVSPDGTRSHARFIDKHSLNFTLLADTEHVLADAVGVWVEKSMYGKAYMGVERSTFLLDAEAQVIKVWRKIKAAGHAADVLAATRERVPG